MMKTVFHPGKILRDKVETMDISAAEIARRIHVPANRVSQIMAEKRNISADTSLRLGKFFGTSPDFWINLQVAYDLDQATQACNLELQAIIPLDDMSMTWGEAGEGAPARSSWGHVAR